MLVFDWGADRINYNCTGGWKAMEQKGYARCKEGILHNLKLWAMMRLVLHVREPADWRATLKRLARAYNFDYVTCCGRAVINYQKNQTS